MNGKGYCLLTSMALALVCAMSGYADAFHGTTFAGENGTEMVGMGYAGNAEQNVNNRAHEDDGGDGYGAVGYNYWIGKTAVSADQFAASGVIADYGGGDTPAVNVSLYQARMYANWLTAEAGGSTFAYSADGMTTLYEHSDLAASGELVYVVSSEDEWYKAAYYNVDLSSYSLFSTGEDDGPDFDNFNYSDFNANGIESVDDNSIVEQNGTIGMMGNVWEWADAADSAVRGGAYNSDLGGLMSSSRLTAGADAYGYNIGFRVAAIPEPGSVALLGLFGGGILFIRRIFIR